MEEQKCNSNMYRGKKKEKEESRMLKNEAKSRAVSPTRIGTPSAHSLLYGYAAAALRWVDPAPS